MTLQEMRWPIVRARPRANGPFFSGNEPLPCNYAELFDRHTTKILLTCQSVPHSLCRPIFDGVFRI
jgi:hypothetical protein